MAKIQYFLVVVALALHLACAEYAKEFQDLDVKTFINDDQHVIAILDCLVNEGCTGRDKKIKDSLVQAYGTLCKDCSPEIESKVREIAKTFVVKQNERWTKVVQKYDPKLEHAAEFKKFLEKA